MTRKSKSKRKPTSNIGKDESPRGGLKSKQTKVQDGAGTEALGPQQTKITFAPTTTEKTLPTTPRGSQKELTTAITPEPSHGVARLPPASPNVPLESSKVEKENTATTTKLSEPKKLPEIVKNKQTVTYASTVTPKNNDTNKNAEDTTTNTNTNKIDINKNNDNTNKTTSSKPSASRTREEPIFSAKLAEKSGNYEAIRYRGIIDAPPSEKPFQAFIKLLKTYMKTVQETLGKHIYLAPWDEEQESTFPILKTKDDVPDSRESLGIYLGTYINPKTDGGKIYMNLRWVTFKKTQFH